MAFGLGGPWATYLAFDPKAEGEAAATARRGKLGRGRARVRGRRMWWIAIFFG